MFEMITKPTRRKLRINCLPLYNLQNSSNKKRYPVLGRDTAALREQTNKKKMALVIS